MLSAALFALLAVGANAQTYRRAAACPGRTCIYPPDQTDFWPGQTFDIRFESHAPVNGSEAYNGGKVDGFVNIEFGPKGGDMIQLSDFFQRANPTPVPYNFTYYEDLFAQDAKAPTPVNVISKSYRNVQLHNPGSYVVRATTAAGLVTEATWEVRDVAGKKVAKNVLFFIGDGMAGSMISAARLLAHKTINGKYQSVMKMDEAPAYGSQMTHSLDSFITDSANSASALFTGKKMTVNGLNAYTDTTGRGFGNPAVETLFEQFRRTQAAQIGIVSKAYIADATPAAVCAHTSQRSQYTAIIEQYLSGITGNQSWNPWEGVDVLFGGGAENFLPGPGNGNVSQFERWGQNGYQVGFNKTMLNAFDNEQRALGIFTQGNISTWLDQNVYPKTLDLAIKPLGGRGAYDQPGLKDMTLKAIDILSTRAKKRGTGWALMSEAALIDKEMHVQDVDRALGDLLELDDTLRHTLEYLEKIGELEETLVVVTADHGHGFDVFGSSDTQYLNSKDSDRAKRNANGVYLESGLSAYQVPQGVNPAHDFGIYKSPQAKDDESYFPITWEPRYTIAHGWAAFPDKREDFQVNVDHERVPAVRNSSGYFFNPEDNQRGFAMTGNLDTGSGQGVHSLVDVPVYAWGPGHELFRGVYSSVDIAFKVADALGVPVTSNFSVPFQK